MDRRERAVSVPVNYTLSIIIVTILLTGLVLATGDQLRIQQQRTVEAEFDVLGNRMAADLGAADRLARSTEGTDEDEVRVRTEIPATVAGVNYLVEVTSTPIVPDEAYEVTITFEANHLDGSGEVRLKTGTPVEDTTLNGGEYVIGYVDDDGDGEPDTLEVRNV